MMVSLTVILSIFCCPTIALCLCGTCDDIDANSICSLSDKIFVKTKQRTKINLFGDNSVSQNILKFDQNISRHAQFPFEHQPRFLFTLLHYMKIFPFFLDQELSNLVPFMKTGWTRGINAHFILLPEVELNKRQSLRINKPKVK